jgi:hypothetical protein
VVEASNDPLTFQVALVSGGGVVTLVVITLFHLGAPLGAGTSVPHRLESSTLRPSWIGLHPHERAGARLAQRMLQRDPAFSAAIVPYAGMVSMLVVIASLNGQMGNPLIERGEAVSGSFLAVYLLGVILPPLYQVLGTSRDHAASWIFHTAPMNSPARVRGGLQRVIHLRFVIPALVAYFVLFTALWRNPVHAAIHCGVGWLVILGVSHVTNLYFARSYPFAGPPVRFEAVARYVLAQAALTTILALVGSIHYQACRSAMTLAAFGAFLIPSTFALRTWVPSVPEGSRG